MKIWFSIFSSTSIIVISLITIACQDQDIEKLEVNAMSAPKVAQYGGPMIIKPKFVSGKSTMSLGETFVGDNRLIIMGKTMVNIDINDPLTFVGDKDYDIIIGTGSIKMDQGKPIDLRTLNVMTTHEIKTLLKSKEPVSKAQGAWALGEIGNETAMPILLKLLKDDHWVVRRYALLSLSQLADLDQTVTIALKSMKDDDDKVVLLAIKILMEKGRKDKRFTEALLKNIEHEDWKIKKVSKMALDQIRSKTVLQDTIREQEITSLDSCIKELSTFEQSLSKSYLTAVAYHLMDNDSLALKEIKYGLETITDSNEDGFDDYIRLNNDGSISLKKPMGNATKAHLTNLLGIIRMRSGHFNDAETLFNEGFNEIKKNPFSHFNLALLNFYFGNEVNFEAHKDSLLRYRYNKFNEALNSLRKLSDKHSILNNYKINPCDIFLEDTKIAMNPFTILEGKSFALKELTRGAYNKIRNQIDRKTPSPKVFVKEFDGRYYALGYFIY